MNNQAIEYVKKRLQANNAILDHVKPCNKPIIENAITELQGVLEVLEIKKSRPSDELKLK